MYTYTCEECKEEFDCDEELEVGDQLCDECVEDLDKAYTEQESDFGEDEDGEEETDIDVKDDETEDDEEEEE